MNMAMRVMATRYWLFEHWDNTESRRHVRRCGAILNPYFPREHDFIPPVGGYRSLDDSFSGWIDRSWSLSWQSQTALTGKERPALKWGYYWNPFVDWTNVQTAVISEIPDFDDDGNPIDDNGNIIETLPKD